MNLLRRLLVWVAATSLGGLLVGLVFSIGILGVVGSADHAKRLLDSTGAYSKIVDGLAQEAGRTSQGGAAAIPLSDPEIVAVAKKAFSPEILRSAVGNFLDGVYAWLDGSVAEPNFQIDTSAAKLEFADGVAAYAAQHYGSLPLCSQDELPISVDPFSDSCRAGDLASAKLADQIRQEIATNKDFLGEPTITASTFASKKNPGQTVFDDLAIAPRIFRVVRTLPIVFGVLAVAACAVIILGDKWRRGLRRIGATLLYTGVFVVLSAFVGRLVFYRLERQSNGILDDGGQLVKDVVNPLIAEVNKRLDSAQLYIGAGYIVVGGVLLICRYYYLRAASRRPGPQTMPAEPADEVPAANYPEPTAPEAHAEPFQEEPESTSDTGLVFRRHPNATPAPVSRRLIQ